jgi:hypothetical protein
MRVLFSWGAVFLIVSVWVTLTHAGAESPVPVLVELFTSEGCSSCPPADALLRTLDSTQPVRGAELIVLSEHVDYWDDLGWRDPHSSHAFTIRQQRYATRLGLASAYTPQMVVDGNLEFVGSDRARANHAFEKASAGSKIEVRISQVQFDDKRLNAHIETEAVPSNSEIFVAVALEHVQSEVLRGENGGHRLEHVAVVESISKVAAIAKAASLSRNIAIPVNSSTGPYRLIAFVQEVNQGRILGATVQHIDK